MKLFSDSRTHIEQLDINKYKYPIPIITISPIKEDDDSCVFLFNGGIGNTLQLVRMLDYPFFNKHYLVSFERKAHGGNKNKPARFI
ncbi:hypothetical protein FACS189459_2100 [Bacilli bacterium]|nr:hypothetical protein FACS189459_2100 [Bacilli bacterium]